MISPEIILSSSSTIKQPTILIFDSGVGGLSVYNKVRQILLNAYYLYIMDNEFLPYGEKSEQFIIDRVTTIIGAIWKLHKIDLIIIACNTASIMSLSVLRECFSCPIIGVVPAIKSAVEITRNGVVGLLATHATVQHSYTQNIINQFTDKCKILQLGTTELVYMAEAKLHGEIVSLSILHNFFRTWFRVSQVPDTIVLGCTHFSLLSQELHAVLPKGIHLVDSSLAIVRHVTYLVDNMDNLSTQSVLRLNKVYCLAYTPQVLTLTPILMRYGFSSLIKLKL